MRKVILAYAGESARKSAELNKIRTTLAGNVELMQPENADAPEICDWILRALKKADFLVIFYGGCDNAETACPSSISSVPRPEGTAEAGEGAKTPPKRRTPMLTAGVRERVPEETTLLLVVFQQKDLATVPPDLEGLDTFNLSCPAEHEALLCRLVHEPVQWRLIPPGETASAIAKVAMGGAATVVGANDKTKDFLLDQFGESVSQVVHYCMALVVIVLLFAGLAALFRIAADVIRSNFPSFEASEKDSKLQILRRTALEHPKIRKWAIIAAALLAAVSFAYLFFPTAPRVDKNLAKHLREWSLRLEKSQLPNGGIRDHPDRKVPQVWCTAQALSGLLCSQEWNSMSAPDVYRAFSFMEQCEILNLELKPDGKQALIRDLPAKFNTNALAKLPARIPTFTLAVGILDRIGGADLPYQTILVLQSNKDNYFANAGPFDGWGYFEQFDWGVTEVSAWVALAKIQSLRATNPPLWLRPQQRERVKNDLREIINFLAKRQLDQEGAFCPDGEISDLSFARTYSTAIALWAMAEAISPELQIYSAEETAQLVSRMQLCVAWLAHSPLKGNLGWKVNPNNPASEDPPLGLTAQVLCILGRLPFRIERQHALAFNNVKAHLLATAGAWSRRSLKTNANDRMHDSDCYLYPTQHVTEPSTFLWYPWCVALMRSLSSDPVLNVKDRRAAEAMLKRLQARAGEFGNLVDSDFNYVAAEALVGFDWPMQVRNEPNL